MSNKSFFSKILLFGEYSVIKDSMALSVPFSLFEGTLRFRSADKFAIDSELKAFGQYLRSLKKADELTFGFQLDSFEFDISQGLYFDSTIPQGFGVGSSAALCAALLDRYGEVTQEQKENMVWLKSTFAQMESHFHGASSGVDPLISYLDRPILIREKNRIGKVCIPNYKSGPGGLFLLNTGRTRRTEPLVNLFLEKCNQVEFLSQIEDRLLPLTNQCITTFLEGNPGQLWEHTRELSSFQLHHFTPMIPKLFLNVWKEGLSSDAYYLKLCGAGGGGFLLGMTKDFKQAKDVLNGHEIRPICFF